MKIIIIIPGSPLNFQGLRAEITFMGSSCAQSASQNHILLRQFTICFNSTLNFKGLKILGTRRNDISVVFTMARFLNISFLLLRKIRESFEEVGDNCRLEFNPDFLNFLCDLLPGEREKFNIYIDKWKQSQQKTGYMGIWISGDNGVKHGQNRPCPKFSSFCQQIYL